METTPILNLMICLTMSFLGSVLYPLFYAGWFSVLIWLFIAFSIFQLRRFTAKKRDNK